MDQPSEPTWQHGRNSNWRQFSLLLWKNWLLQKKKIIRTILILLFPMFVSAILVTVRELAKVTVVDLPRIYSNFDVNTGIATLFAYGPRQPINIFIAYVPDTPLAQRILKRASTMQGVDGLSALGFASETALEDALLKNDDIFAAIVFLFPRDTESLPKNITYKVRLQSYSFPTRSDDAVKKDFRRKIDWKTDAMFSDLIEKGPRQRSENEGGLPGYAALGFLLVQHAIDLSLIFEVNGKFDPTATVKVHLHRYPFPPYSEDELTSVFVNVLPLFILISFIIMAPTICQEIVLEKENKFKELMKLMGMSTWMYWSSWFVKYLLFMLISVGAMTAFIHAPLSSNGPVVAHTSASITFTLLLLYALSIITFCFALSTLVHKAKYASALGGMLFILSFAPYFYLSTVHNNLSLGIKLATMLDFNVAMGFACFQICQNEARETTADWSDIWAPLFEGDEPTMGVCLAALMIDTIIYSIITWYLDAVIPGDYGSPQPLCFPFMTEYWKGRKITNMESTSDNYTTEDKGPFFEAPLLDAKAGIKIRGLTKNFGSKTNPAVNNINIDFYEGNITALLGHNGAGKTTTMFMLTGILPPSKGTALINGFDITREMDKIRQSLGLCPQHDILFDTLTVREHLLFFAVVKGSPLKMASLEMKEMIEVLHLEEKINAQVQTLSGGQKRKLSVGIALISGSKFVILDEPTSGMDPEARRQIWDILQSQRKDRTMILSTHYMDEADLLGDRIAIMSSGEIQCYGTPMFLKNAYGVGYQLTVVKRTKCDVNLLRDVIKSQVSKAQLVSDKAEEVTFILPSQQSSKFKRLFETLEKDRKSLRIDGFGVSVTTMEDVFLRVRSSATLEGEPKTSTVTDAEILGTKPHVVIPHSTGNCWQRHTFQLRAMLYKRVIHSIRNYVVTLGQLLIPILFTVLACSTILDPTRIDYNFRPLTLDLTHFQSPITPFYTSQNPDVKVLDLVDCYNISVSRHSRPLFVNDVPHKPLFQNYLIDIGEYHADEYNWNYQIGASVYRDPQGRLSISGYFNNQAFHTVAISLSYVGNALMQCYGDKEYQIETINHPLPRNPSIQVIEDVSQTNSTGMGFTSCILFGMAFLFATFLMFLIKERTSGAKHSQLVSGVRLHNFWLATFLWDYFNYLVPCAWIIIVILCFRVDGYWQYSWLVFVGLMLYGFSMLPFTYLMSFLFGEPSVGFIWLSATCIVTGVFANIIIYALQELESKDTWQTVELIFYSIFPSYCFNLVLKNIYKNHNGHKICNQLELEQKDGLTVYCQTLTIYGEKNPCCPDNCGDKCMDMVDDLLSWTFPGVGFLFVCMAAQGAAFFLILIIIESNMVERLLKVMTPNRLNRDMLRGIDGGGVGKISEDSDVLNERKRIQSTPIKELVKTDTVVTQDLTMLYGSFVAVNLLSIGVSQKDCFGLLGTNGAGKTTIFKMLTGEIRPSFGSAYVVGISVQKDITQVHQKIGYCAQFDSIIDEMTVHETLWMYACAHGIRPQVREEVIDRLIEQLTLKPYIKKKAGNLSGGNKRKLCVAVALMGNPVVVFLDEPTTGIDPEARRHVWNTLVAVRNTGTTIVLTSHSMEECEAICTRMAILVNGRFLCLGRLQHLRDRFSDGYTLIVKLRRSAATDGPEELQERIEKLKAFISETFPQYVLKDHHENLLTFQIKMRSFKWSKIFGLMEAAKVTYEIEDYSVGQTTLEQLFIDFARLQGGSREITKRKCCVIC